MGVIEISDGTTNRRIPIRELYGTIRIETDGNDRYLIAVPERYVVVRSQITDRADTESSPVKDRIDAALAES